MRIFYGAGHEQFAPSDLLRHARLADDAGFDGRGPPLPPALGLAREAEAVPKRCQLIAWARPYWRKLLVEGDRRAG
jgi:hypothetical protein